MLDGSTPWLSVDLRVFQMTQGDVRFGHTMGADGAGAVSMIQGVLNRFNSDLSVGRAEFATISTDPETSRLELARMRGGQRVFNFAVAQVRYAGRTLSASDVRLFFRMFTTAATGMEFRPETYPRLPHPVGAQPVPVLGLLGGEIATIPFFASPRVNSAVQRLREQTDAPNTKTIDPSPSGETTAYFGCWLDINQTELRFPLHPGGDGPYSSGLRTIQELIRGRHQCLVAEVEFAGDPIPIGATPGSSDNLSQRNLVIVESDNPGDLATHTVHHTFEIRPTPQRGVALPATQLAVLKHEGPALELAGEAGSDELMIRWGNLPRSSRVTLYLPGVGAEPILRLDEMRIGARRLVRVDDDTLECPVGDVTWVPIPSGQAAGIPGLLTIELPAGVRKGQKYEVVVHQVDGLKREVIGTFQLSVLVGTRDTILPEEERTLAVLRHIALSIPAENRWFPVFNRYVGSIADRVRGLGGDPDLVKPSPDGTDSARLGSRPETSAPGEGICCRFPRMAVAFLAVLVVALGLPASVPVLVLCVVAGLAALGVLLAWQRLCRPGLCAFLGVLLAGFAAGAGLLAVLTLLGLGGAAAPAVIAGAAVVAGVAALLSVARGCFRWCGEEEDC
jgi:hypothetical protein